MSVTAMKRERRESKRTREKLYLDVHFTKSVESADGSGDLILSGYASTWDLDRDNEMVAPDAFDGSLNDYLSKNPVVLWQHDRLQPIGRVLTAKTDATGLYVTVRIPNPGPDAADWQKGAYQSIRIGNVTTFSIGGYFTRDVEMGPDGPVFTIVEVELFEVSCVSIPANASSLFEAVMKAFHEEPPAFHAEAREQLEQLLGVRPFSDPALVAMGVDDRVKRFKHLTALFVRSYGVEPPPAGAWKAISAAKAAGVSPLKVARAKSQFIHELYPDLGLEPEAKAGRKVSAATRAKLQAALDAHDGLEQQMVKSAEAMRAAAGHHREAKDALMEVLGINADGQVDGTADEDEEGDEMPTSGKAAPEDEESEKQLQSDVMRRLREAGQERFAQPPQSAGYGAVPASPYCYCYVDDVDMDAGFVVFCVYNRDGDGDDDYVKVPFTRTADGGVALAENEQEVIPSSGYAPKGLDVADEKAAREIEQARKALIEAEAK